MLPSSGTELLTGCAEPRAPPLPLVLPPPPPQLLPPPGLLPALLLPALTPLPPPQQLLLLPAYVPLPRRARPPADAACSR